MRYLYTADLHFSNYSNDLVVKETGLSERLHSLVSTLLNMIKYAREARIKTLTIGGDILHNKSVIYSFALSVLIDILKNNSDITFILLDGNHDMSSRTSDCVSGLKSLDAITNVHVIHEIERSENILFVPWKHITKELVQKESADYLISHFGLNEAVLNSGISIVSDISIKDLTNFKTVLLGHYHKAQELKYKDTDLYYVGSLIQLDRGEKNEEKRFLEVDTDLNTVISIPSIGYKKFYEFTLTEENKQKILDEARELKNFGHEGRLLKTSSVDTTSIDKECVVVDKQEKDITNRGITSNMSASDKLNRFLEIKGIPEDKREM